MKMGKKQFSALSFILSTAIFWEMLAVTSVLADNAYPSWEQPIGNLTEKSGAQAVCSVRLSRIFINKLCESDDEGGFGSAYSAESMDDTGSPVEKDCYTGSAKEGEPSYSYRMGIGLGYNKRHNPPADTKKMGINRLPIGDQSLAITNLCKMWINHLLGMKKMKMNLVLRE